MTSPLSILNLNIIWFVLVGVLFMGYAILDGFDFGVGAWHLFVKKDENRRILLNAIGPVWDGNEVWLVTGGGALFAAFPEAYATIFSGFYLAFMLLLFALIFRAVSIEFRSKMQSPGWRRAWDTGFFASSLLATLLFGVAVGNGMIGIPLNERGVFTGRLLDLLGLYPLLLGLLAISMFAMHGCLYLNRKVPPGPLQDRLRDWIWHTWGIFQVLYILSSMYTLVAVPRAVSNFQNAPWAVGVVVLNVLAVANLP